MFHLQKIVNSGGIDYDNIPVHVHGGLTFCEKDGDNWVIGFDCAHSGDLSPHLLEISLDDNSHFSPYPSGFGVYRDKKFVISEC
jgi:hypothetical protein